MPPHHSPPADDARSAGPLTNPFPGPQPYRASDRARFHGRDAVARELTSMILAHRSVALFGPSGAGKSSVMQAAVLPTLADDHDFRLASVDGWPAGEAPVAWLLEALLRDLKLAPPTEPLGVFASVEWMVEQAFYRSDRPILIVLDQIEQLLFSQRDAAEVAHFLDWLDRFAGQPLRGLHLVLAMREDYLGRFRDRARGRHRLLEHGFRLGPMTVGEITGAVITAAGGGAPPQTWSHDSTRSLMLQVRVPGQRERDDAEVQTAFAQIVCRALFAQRATADSPHSDTDTRAEPILQNYLEGALAALGPLRGPAEQLLEDHLIAADGTRTLLTEEAARASGLATPTDLDTLLTDLERAAILRAEQHRGTRYFELGHDWLARKVHDRKQERLARTAEEVRERARETEQRAAAEALARARAETRRARRVVAVVTLFGLLAATLGVAAWLQREAALAAEESVRAERDRANELLETAKKITRALLLEALPKYEDIPGTADVQREIHERLKTILISLRNDAGDDPDVVHLEIQQKIKRGSLAMTHERLDQAREEFSQALALAERIAAEHPDEAQAQRDIILPLQKLGDLEMHAGDLAAARALFDAHLRVTELRAAADPTSALDQRDLSISLERLGDVAMRAGDLSAARGHYERCREVRELLAATDPSDARAQRDFAVALQRLGSVEIQAANLPAARDLLARYLKVNEMLAANNPTSVQVQRELGMSLEMLGDIERQLGNPAAARDLLDRSLKVSEALVTADPASTQAQSDLTVALERLGNLERQAGNLTGARALFERALQVNEALVAADPANAQAQRGLWVQALKVGDVEVMAGKFAAARVLFERGVKVSEALAAGDITSALARRDLSISLEKLGGVERQVGNLAAARAFLDRSLTIREALAAGDSTNALAQNDLANSLDKLAELEQQAGDLAAARGFFDRALAVREALAVANPTGVRAQRRVSDALERLAYVELQAGDLARTRGHLERAITVLDPLTKATPGDAETSFRLVVVHIALVDLARKEKRPESRREHLEAARALLDAMAARGQLTGFKDREAAKERVDKELAALKP